MTVATQSEGAATPFRINFIGYTEQTRDTLEDNVRRNASVPLVTPRAPHERPLAIVGGGPSLTEAVSILRNWPGDLWSINKTGDWLHTRNVQSVLYSVDASEKINEMCDPASVTGAIFSSWCAPNIVQRYPNACVFHMHPIVENGIKGGSTSAVSAPLLALQMGYQNICFFGCESSYITVDHVDRHEAHNNDIIVRANNKFFRTQPPLYIQAQELSRIIKQFPQVFCEHSGGLLRAMIADDNWEVVHVSDALAAHFDEVNREGIETIAKRYEGRF